MNLRFLQEGSKFTLYSIEQGDSVHDFLAKLEQSNTGAHDQIVSRLDQLAAAGVTRKQDHFNDLGDGLYEAKAKSGPRVIFFYDKNQIVLCTHGFLKAKQKTPTKELKTALAKKKAYFDFKKEGSAFQILYDSQRKLPTRFP